MSTRRAAKRIELPGAAGTAVDRGKRHAGILQSEPGDFPRIEAGTQKAAMTIRRQVSRTKSPASAAMPMRGTSASSQQGERLQPGERATDATLS